MRKVLKRLKLNKKGFTFAECIVAIALFAIVGTLAFTMFNTATRYMSKAKKEEAKRAQAQEQALLNTFKYKEGDEVKGYIIYPSRVCRCRTSARQKATCRSTQWCLITTPITARYRLRLRSKK